MNTHDVVRRVRGTLGGQANRVRKRGHAAFCPCCRTWQRSFGEMVMPDRQCWVCGSLERHRLLTILFAMRPELLRPGMSALHVAPEPQVAKQIRRSAARYVSGDVAARFGPEVIDVTDLPFSAGEFDAVVCNHVLEHVPDDRRAMAEIRRVLRTGGWALLLVPDVKDAATFETPEITDPQELSRLHGQHDHVRTYGWDYLDRLRDAGLETEVLRLDTVLTDETIRTCRLLKFGEVEPVFLARPVPVPAAATAVA